jgi:hypothetical protein
VHLALGRDPVQLALDGRQLGDQAAGEDFGGVDRCPARTTLS